MYTVRQTEVIVPSGRHFNRGEVPLKNIPQLKYLPLGTINKLVLGLKYRTDTISIQL